MEKRKINSLLTLETVKDCYEIHLKDGYGSVYSTKTCKYLKPTIGKGKDNYVHFNLVTTNGKTRKGYLHRLIALAFLLDGYKEGYFVDHGDNDKSNNHISNLEWLSHADNTRKAVVDGCGIGRPKVEKKPKMYVTKLEKSVSNSKGLTFDDVTRIFVMLDDGYSQSKIAKILNVKQPTINQIANGKRWKEHPSVIEYVY